MPRPLQGAIEPCPEVEGPPDPRFFPPEPTRYTIEICIAEPLTMHEASQSIGRALAELTEACFAIGYRDHTVINAMTRIIASIEARRGR